MYIMVEKPFYQVAAGTFGSIAGSFVADSLRMMVPWLVAMFCVIVCDLVTGLRRSFLMKESVRFSRACRATMGKAVTYFSFVVMVVMVNRAAGGGMHIDTWACLLVCAVEGCSIASNILKPKGYTLDVAAAVAVMARKALGVDKDDLKGVISKEKDGGKVNGDKENKEEKE